jgi:hypothetical protein
MLREDYTGSHRDSGGDKVITIQVGKKAGRDPETKVICDGDVLDRVVSVALHADSSLNILCDCFNENQVETARRLVAGHDVILKTRRLFNLKMDGSILVEEYHVPVPRFDGEEE